MTKDEKRKSTPIFDGVLAYFPDAIAEVAHCSRVANEQHNAGQPMHWNKSASADELGSLTRHLVDIARGEEIDDDGILHRAKIAWRALASLQRYLDGEYDYLYETDLDNTGVYGVVEDPKDLDPFGPRWDGHPNTPKYGVGK